MTTKRVGLRRRKKFKKLSAQLLKNTGLASFSF